MYAVRFAQGTAVCPACGGTRDARARHCNACRFGPLPAGYVSVEDAAAQLGVSPSAVKMRIARGTLRSETFGRRRGIPVAALDEVTA
jgi:excisionase family DNA binding protein